MLASQFTFANCPSDLSRRDDLESLAYTLLFLLRGSLPWQRSPSESSTLLARMAQVREKKRAWTGARLGEGFPDAFGQLLDHSRALGFDENPDYARFQTLFDDLSWGISFSRETFGGPNMVSCSMPTCEHSSSLLSLNYLYLHSSTSDFANAGETFALPGRAGSTCIRASSSQDDYRGLHCPGYRR
jgi:hypothetical protein